MDEILWAWEISEKIKKKMEVVAARNRYKVPYTTKDGVFDDLSDNICWWTNGFWGGMMWQLYHATKNELYRENAERLETKLDENLMRYEGMDHDSGFKWLTTAVANYRMNGSKASYNRGRLAADNLAGRFNPVGKFIRAWNDWGEEHTNAGRAIIDCMMNLPLLYWAYEQTKDYRYLHIAQMHADTTAEYFIRENGSVNHIVEFNPKTGAYVKSHGGQGCGEGSSWTRGQAWALYGFTLSYLHTKEDRYLQSAKKIADYFLSQIPETGLIWVDFCQPEDCTWEDSTAAAIASCGLLELAKCIENKQAAGDLTDAAMKGNIENDKAVYRTAALKLLHALAEKRCNWSEECDNLLEKCTAAFHDKEHEFTIIYGDYYFIEAIFKLTGEEFFIW
ncbi:MAG: glycoside hydrolase family 88 protein [Lachnospiraceae bacterium]